MEHNLLQIKKGMYLAQDDLFFFEKYLRFFPKDAAMRYEYAKLLEAEGKAPAAFIQYEQAAKLGHLAAIGKLKMWAAAQKTGAAARAARAERRWWRGLFYLLLGFLLAALLLLFFRWWFAHDLIQTTRYETYTSEVKRSFGSTEQTSAPELPLLVVENALERYKQATGSYPPNLSALTAHEPDNWLSFLPRGVTYSLGEHSYTLSYAGEVPSFSERLLELDYYPEANQVAVQRGDEVLAIYPVASGNPLPFRESSVAKRVVDPNGGAGALGTRGFELQDEYAIHGTNQPAEVGQKGVTHGCLRMKNEQIETLYPYIALGTPFYVQSGTPARATFPAGLPVLAGQVDGGKEQLPGVHLNWRE